MGKGWEFHVDNCRRKNTGYNSIHRHAMPWSRRNCGMVQSTMRTAMPCSGGNCGSTPTRVITQGAHWENQESVAIPTRQHARPTKPGEFTAVLHTPRRTDSAGFLCYRSAVLLWRAHHATIPVLSLCCRTSLPAPLDRPLLPR